jgi:sugar-specific transcriptional regulator TrmB
VYRLSQELIKKALRSFGLTEKEAEIYIFLAKHGVLKGGEISKQTKTQKALVYRILKSLQTKGLVESTLESPARFMAVSFEKVIDMNIRTKQEEAAHIATQKKDLLNYWQNIKKNEPELPIEKFAVIEGKRKIYFKLSQMMREAKNQLSTVATVQGFMSAAQFGFLDADSDYPSKSKINFRLITELSSQNISPIKKILKKMTYAKFNFEGRTPELELNLFPQMTIRDQEEALFFIARGAGAPAARQDDVCLWTNCKSLVDAFSNIFEDLWLNSIDMQKKIVEIETGKLMLKTFVIGDAEIARKKYNETVRSAKEEIFVVTSSEGLFEFWKKISELKEWTEKGISIKIMAPIVGDNLEVAEQLSKLCTIRHIPPNYLHTTIVDGKHLFQFKTSAQGSQKLGATPHFDNTFYTNNPEYVQKTKAMLTEQLKNARPPRAENLAMYTDLRCVACYPGAICGPGPYGTFYPLPPDPLKKSEYPVIEIVNDDPSGKLTEQEVLNQIVNAQKNPANNKLWRFYASQAIAIIHPPDFFNLPPMLIRVHQVEKHSTLGAEDVIIINLWLETPNGPAYVPVAVLVDSPKTQTSWKMNFAAAPAGRNVRLARKDELQIRVHGNTLFAGWTVPIPLLPSQHVLPPACMLIEGYGDVKTAAYTITNPWGGKVTAKQNGFDAFVTFMHPSSKYSGPGTDGFFVRDFVADVSPNIFKEHPPSLEHSLIEKGKT